MTTTADTPLQRAAKAIKLAFQFKQFGRQLPNGDWATTRKDIEEFEATAETATRAALVAALQVRWEEGNSAWGIKQETAFLGPIRVAVVYLSNFDGLWVEALEPFLLKPGNVGTHPNADDAKSAVERAVIEAILGVSIHTASGDEDEHSPRTGGDQQGD